MSTEAKVKSPIIGIKWLDMFGSEEAVQEVFRTILQERESFETARDKAIIEAHRVCDRALVLLRAKEHAAYAALAEIEIAKESE